MAGLPPNFSLGDILGQNMSGELSNSVAAQAGPYVGGLPALPVGGSTGVYNNPVLAARLRKIAMMQRLSELENTLSPTIAPSGGFPMGRATPPAYMGPAAPQWLPPAYTGPAVESASMAAATPPPFTGVAPGSARMTTGFPDAYGWVNSSAPSNQPLSEWIASMGPEEQVRRNLFNRAAATPEVRTNLFNRAAAEANMAAEPVRTNLFNRAAVQESLAAQLPPTYTGTAPVQTSWVAPGEAAAANAVADLAPSAASNAARTAATDLTMITGGLPAGVPLEEAVAPKGLAALLGKYGKYVPEGLTLGRGIAGLGAGLVTEKLAGGLGDLIVGGEASDPGFSWGGLGKAAVAGGAGGAVSGGIMGGGPVGALVGAPIGALLGAGSYLLNESEWAKKEVNPEDEKAKMQSFVSQYGIDPTLAKQVIGNYDIMAKLYMQNEDTRGQMKDLTRQSMTSLAGLIGQRSNRITPEQAQWLSKFSLDQLQPYYNQISENSPYKVAALQQMAAIPANISLQSLISPQGVGMMGASNAPAQMAAGLSPEQMKALENA